MPDSGQATAPEGIDSLAAFLADNPHADGSGPAPEEKKQQNSESPEEDKDEEQEVNGQDSGQKSDPEENSEETEGDKLPEESEEEKRPSLKFKVPVKDDDGTEKIEEVDQDELIKGYQRHADYTRKTMKLAEQEREVTQAVATRLQERETQLLQQLQMAHTAVRQVAGLKTPEEMAALASSDPSLWVSEKQRETAVHGVLAHMEQQARAIIAQQQQRTQEEKAKSYRETWDALSKDGINAEKLKGIFEAVHSKYGIPEAVLAGVENAGLVRALRDAAEYQALKAKKQEVTKQATEAPRLPSAKQVVPKNEQLRKRLDSKFASGKAKIDDLAAYLRMNKI